MKILTSSLNMSPPRLSVTYFNDKGKLKQFGADSTKINEFIEKSDYNSIN